MCKTGDWKHIWSESVEEMEKDGVQVDTHFSKNSTVKKKKRKGTEKAKMFQTHIYDLELNCLSVCNSLRFLLQAGGEQSASSVILLSVSSYIHPSDLRVEVSGPPLQRLRAFGCTRNTLKTGQSSG